jgi:ABC-type multidrug transport system fused ATPase/permease subunit
MKSLAGIWSILSPAQRSSAFGLVGLMIVAMLLEMVGLGLVIPSLGLMASDAPAKPSPQVAAWLNWLGTPSRGVLLLWGLLAILGLYAVKAVFLLFSTWRQTTFVRAIQCDVSERLFRTYLLQPWPYHLQHNSSMLVRNINDVVLVANQLTTTLGTLAEVLVMTGIVAVLIWFEPIGALTVAAVLAMAAMVMEKATKSRLTHWGKQFQSHSAMLNKHLVQGLHAAKDIKVLGCEAAFIDYYAHYGRRRATVLARQSLFAQMPRLWFECVAVASLCALTAVMVWQGRPTKEMIPTLGLFAAAAFRLLPSVNKLSMGFQGLRFSSAIIDTIVSDLALPVPSPDGAAGNRLVFRNAIELDNVTFRYPAATTPSLTDVRLKIPHGASVGLIGGSGAGKSTLVDIVLGLLAPTAGRVLVDGADIRDRTRPWQRIVGYVPQAIYLADDTIRRNVAFGLQDDQIDDTAVAKALASAQIDEFVAGLPDGVDTLVGDRGVRLSGGQRQRIGIARALYNDPALLVLDEATSALDNDTERGVMDAIESLHGAKTLLIVAHRLTTVERCDLIYDLADGRIVRCGSFSEVVGQ